MFSCVKLYCENKIGASLDCSPALDQIFIKLIIFESIRMKDCIYDLTELWSEGGERI